MKRSDPTDVKITNTKLNGMYRGVVEDNEDPDKRGRVRVRIFGLHSKEKTKTLIEGVPTEELPWAEPCLPIMEGGISGFGVFGVPVRGSHVMVFFENGSILQPRYFASLPGYPTEAANKNEGFNDPAGQYPTSARLNQPDWHRLARGEKGETLVSTKASMRDSEEPTSPYAAKYPHNLVIVTHGGVTIELDSTPNNERLHLYHPSNSYIEIDKDGNMVIRSTKDKYDITVGNKTEHVVGNSKILIDGNCDIEVGGICNVKATIINLN